MRTLLLLTFLGIYLATWAQNPEEINPKFPGQNMMSMMASPQIIEDSKNNYSPSDNFAPQQIISIPQGWSGISGFIIPDNPNIEFLLKPLMDKFVILYNQDGMYFPEQNINTLVNWNPQSGYIAKFSQSASMGLSGQVNTNRTITLNAGWNLIPVLSNCPVNVAEFFQTQDMVVVKDVASYKLYWPVMGINTLNELLPGKAYYVLMNAPGVITFPDCTVPAWQCGEPFVDPRDNRVYNTVQIGAQCWMAQNLNYGARLNGNQSQQNNSIAEKYCYNNLESECYKYGGLYQWDEMMQYTQGSGTQGLCPAGWYISNESEWSWLSNYLGGNATAGGALKSTASGFWSQPNTGATNSAGFNGLPGGQRETVGMFSNQTYFGNFWTTTAPDDATAARAQLAYNSTQLALSANDKNNGFSVRCRKREILNLTPTSPALGYQENTVIWSLDASTAWTIAENIPWLSLTPLSGSGITSLTVMYDENAVAVPRSGVIAITPDGGAPALQVTVSQEGAPAWINISPETLQFMYTPGVATLTLTSNALWTVIEDIPWLSVDPMSGSLNQTLNVTYETNNASAPRSGHISIIAEGGAASITVSVTQAGKTCGPTFTDSRDGQTYTAVQIGSQCWMAENLNIGTMINGSAGQTNNGTIEKYCPGNSGDQCDVYGGLYQWNEMMEYSNGFGLKGICPEGWRLPEAAEWDALILTLGGEFTAGGALKTTGTMEAGTGLWLAPNAGATNSSGFSLLPAGYRFGEEGVEGTGFAAILWSSDYQGAMPGSYVVSYDTEDIFKMDIETTSGFSVRCIINDTTKPYIRVTPAHSQLPANAGSVNFTVASNANWQVTEESDWLSVSPASGTCSGQFTVTYNANVVTSLRTASVWVIAEGRNIELTLTQAAFVPTLTVTPDSIMLPYIAGTAVFTVQSNTAWTVAENIDWFTVSPTNGSGNATLTLTYLANHNTEIRLGQFTVTSTYGAPVVTVSVSQDYFICGNMLIDRRDGKTYNTVQIGNQCWMAQNLNVGEMINSTDTSLNNGIIEKFCYKNQTYYCYLYGGLYQWDEMMQYTTTPGVTGICPSGWHIPSDQEWNVMLNYVSSQPTWLCSSIPNSIAKALASTTLWDTYSGYAPCAVGYHSYSNNATGFSGVPAGLKTPEGDIQRPGLNAIWWSSTFISNISWAYDIRMWYGSSDVERGFYPIDGGQSVRCLKDDTTTSQLEVTPSNQDVTSQSGTTTFNISSNTSWEETENVSWLSVSPTNGNGNATLTVTYDANPESTPRVGEITITAAGGNPVVVVTVSQAAWSCGNSLIDTRDGKSYTTVQIGTQCWMAQNLNIGTRIDGSLNQTNNGSIEKYCYDNSETNCDVYGGLYQWNEMMQYSTTPGVQGICPQGWHVPTDVEWTALTNSVSSQPAWVCGGNTSYNAKALASSTGWYSDIGICTVGNNQLINNATGFTGLPGGARMMDGSFGSQAGDGFWWSSSQDTSSSVWHWSLFSWNASVVWTINNKAFGFSVRCLKD